MGLTDVVVRGAKPRNKDYRLIDGHGLYIQVTAKGTKLWRWKYRFQHKQKFMSLGTYPDVSIIAARNAHASGCQLLAKGVNPLAAVKTMEAPEVPEVSVVHTASLNPFSRSGGRLVREVESWQGCWGQWLSLSAR